MGTPSSNRHPSIRAELFSLSHSRSPTRRSRVSQGTSKQKWRRGECWVCNLRDGTEFSSFSPLVGIRAKDLLGGRLFGEHVLPRKLHGTGIYAAPLTPQSTPGLIGKYGSPMDCLGEPTMMFSTSKRGTRGAMERVNHERADWTCEVSKLYMPGPMGWSTETLEVPGN